MFRVNFRGFVLSCFRDKKEHRTELQKTEAREEKTAVGRQRTEDRGQRAEDLEIDYSLLDIGHSFSSEYQIINIQCPMIKYLNDAIQL